MPRRIGKALDRDGIFTRKDRPGAFYGSWKDASGKRRKRKLAASTLEQAKTLLAAEVKRADEIKTKGYTEPTKESFAALLPRYTRFQKPLLSQRSYERTSGIVKNQLLPAFGAMPLGMIRRGDVQRFVTHRSGKVSPGSVVKELNVLKHIMTLAVEWELITVNPAIGVKGPSVPEGRLRYLTPGELRAVLQECPTWLRPIVALASFTAMRRGEILALRWMHVDLSGRRLMLSQTKNGRARIVHLNRMAVEVIQGQQRENAKQSDRVFPPADYSSADNVSKGFATVCRRLDIEDVSFHTLRHTCASWLRMQGADIHTVAALLGHRDLRMAMRYQHLSPEFLGAAVDRLDSVFGEQKQLPSPIDVPPSPQRPQTEKGTTDPHA